MVHLSRNVTSRYYVDPRRSGRLGDTTCPRTADIDDMVAVNTDLVVGFSIDGLDLDDRAVSYHSLGDQVIGQNFRAALSPGFQRTSHQVSTVHTAVFDAEHVFHAQVQARL